MLGSAPCARSTHPARFASPSPPSL
jgi:hypothetical protein